MIMHIAPITIRKRLMIANTADATVRSEKGRRFKSAIIMMA